ncbi:MAG: HlyD family efflux transporter periplasmic adaptor subunit [Paraclostridium sp.]
MKKKKIKYSILVLIGIFIYILVNIGSIFIRKNIDTEVISSEKIEESIRKKGLLIRDEYVINSSMSGKIEGYFSEGDKVKKSDKVAYVYNSNINKDNVKELKNLENEVIEIKEGQTSLIKSDMDKVNKEIKVNRDQIQNKILEGNLSIGKETSDLEILIADKNKLLKSDLNSKPIKNKEEEINTLSKKIEKNSDVLTTNKSGVISYKFDGNESKYNIENISELTIDDIENTNDEYIDILTDGNIKSGEPVARVINNTKQYLAIVVEKEEIKKLEENSSVIICNGNTRINAKLHNIFTEEDRKIVVFEISEQNIEINDTRVAEFDIIYKSIEGIKIPKKCIVEDNKKQGVYIVSETGNAKFVEIKGISYENEEFIVIDYYKNKIDGIKTVDIYDEIILEPKKVKDGSIVK